MNSVLRPLHIFLYQQLISFLQFQIPTHRRSAVGDEEAADGGRRRGSRRLDWGRLPSVRLRETARMIKQNLG
ncbi:hypothetical protein R6Q59_018636 [Mikania micrantha]